MVLHNPKLTLDLVFAVSVKLGASWEPPISINSSSSLARANSHTGQDHTLSLKLQVAKSDFNLFLALDKQIELNVL